MTTRDVVPAGAPVWADLWTSDVDRSRAFYSELFGWEAGDPDPDFGGYFMFLRNGVPVAGGMGDMPDAKADNSWKTYFHTSDAAKVAAAVTAAGGTTHFEPMAVGDLGTQVVFSDPTGGVAAAWQPNTFHGFAELEVPGTPSWFELHTRDHAGELAFYHEAFGWDFDFVSDSDEFRYAMVRNPDGGMGMAGAMDNRNDLPEGAPSVWSIYWEVASVDDTIATAITLGGTSVSPAEDTPYGRLAVMTDPTGATFSLRTSPS